VVADLISQVQWPEATQPEEDGIHSMHIDEAPDIMLNGHGSSNFIPNSASHTTAEIDPSLMGISNSAYSIQTSHPTILNETSDSKSGGVKRAVIYPPSYEATGKSFQETSFYDLLDGLKLGEPCWMLHQGECEHVFTFDEIRLLHPTDPSPTLGSPSSDLTPYPVTTFLSRLNVNKCNVCERDPATRVTVNDVLAGISPCPICDVCFTMLHGDLDGARNAGIEVIPIIEDLA